MILIMIEQITEPIPLDGEVVFIPEPPHYFTISRDPEHQGLVCSYSGRFEKEGEPPLHDEAINASLLSDSPLYKLIPLYADLKAKRDKSDRNLSENKDFLGDPGNSY